MPMTDKVRIEMSSAMAIGGESKEDPTTMEISCDVDDSPRIFDVNVKIKYRNFYDFSIVASTL